MKMEVSTAYFLPYAYTLLKVTTLWLMCNPCSARLDYQIGSDLYWNGASVTSFPHNHFPSDVNKIDVVQNPGLTAVDYIEPFAQLYKIYLSQNSLIMFPDLFNMSQILTYLDLSHNQISYIPPGLLNQLVVLEYLYMPHNPLLTVPDVPGPGNSLIVLSIHNTEVTDIPVIPNLGKRLNYYILSDTHISSVSLSVFESSPKLGILALSLNSPISLPNMMEVDYSQRDNGLVVEITELVCDTTVLSILPALEPGAKLSLTMRSTVMERSSCGQTGPVAGKELGNLNMSHLAKALDVDLTSGFTSVLYERIPGLTCCFPVISEVIPSVTDITSCAALCLADPHCYLFSYGTPGCVLAQYKDDVYGTETDFNQYVEWYLVK